MPAARPGRRAAAVPARAARTTRRWRGRAVRRWNERSLRRLHGSGVGRTAAAVADRCLRLTVEYLLQFAEPRRIEGAAVERQHGVADLQDGEPKPRVDDVCQQRVSVLRLRGCVIAGWWIARRGIPRCRRGGGRDGWR